MCNENSLCGLDNNNTILALFQSSSVIMLDAEDKQRQYLSGVKTLGVFGLGKNVSFARYVKTICPQRVCVRKSTNDLLQLSRGSLFPVNISAYVPYLLNILPKGRIETGGHGWSVRTYFEPRAASPLAVACRTVDCSLIDVAGTNHAVLSSARCPTFCGDREVRC